MKNRQLTKSEQFFEEFCKLHNVVPVRLSEHDGHKQPDYELSFNEQKIIFEIKQVEPNEADKKFTGALKSERIASQVRDPNDVAERIRNLIKSAVKQIKSYHKANALIPAVVVIYDNANNQYTDSYTIQTAMHGWEQVSFSISANNQAPKVVERGFGPRNNKAIRHDKNEEVSAIATLHECWDMLTKERFLAMNFYHNPHATKPFCIDWWNNNRIGHYILEEKTTGQFQNWKKLDNVKA